MIKSKRLATVLATLGLTALLAGCAGTQSLKAPQLAERSLMWADAISEHCEIPPSLQFQADRFAGDAACNRVFGSYKLEGTKLTFDHMGVTRRMCGPKLMEVESKFLDNLNKTRFASESKDGKGVIFYDENMKPLMTMVPETMGACN